MTPAEKKAAISYVEDITCLVLDAQDFVPMRASQYWKLISIAHPNPNAHEQEFIDRWKGRDQEKFYRIAKAAALGQIVTARDVLNLPALRTF